MVGRVLSWEAVPAPVRAVAQRLHEAGHAVWLTGEGLLDLLRGERPRGWLLSVSASAAALTERLEHAVPVRRDGAAFVVPTAAGPVDVVRLRWGNEVEADLDHGGLRMLAMAWSWPDGALIDPHGGQADLASGRIATVGESTAALAEQPLLGLVAARMVAEHACELAPALLRALREAPDDLLAAVPASLLRREISALLLAREAGRGLAVLRESGLERAFGLRTEAAATHWIDAMPQNLELRLFAWTAGHSVARLLTRLRINQESRRRVTQLVQYHPVESRLGGSHRSTLRRALRHLPENALDALIVLRETQLADAAAGSRVEEARGALDALRESVARLREEADLTARGPVLIWRGADVMQGLGIGPGPVVGAVLRYLKERVAADTRLNSPDALCGLLADWQATRPAEGNGSAC